MVISAPTYRPVETARARSPFGAVAPRKADGGRLEGVDGYFPSHRASKPWISREAGQSTAVGAAAGATPGFPLQLILLGPPGSGKTTQAERLAEKYQVPHISVGRLLAEEVARGSEVGKQVQPYMEKGDLAPSGLVYEVLAERLSQPDAAGGFIIDGYPREMAQVPLFEKLLTNKNVTNLQVLGIEVCDEEVKTRLMTRGRVDDKPEVVDHRLDVYRDETSQVVDYFINQGVYFVVDGQGSVDEVTRRIEECAVPSP